MLHPPQHAGHLFEEDADRSVGAYTQSAYNSASEATPGRTTIPTPFAAGSGKPVSPLHDIYAEQNARLQGWALRSQTCLPIKLEDKLNATFAAPRVLDDNKSKSADSPVIW